MAELAEIRILIAVDDMEHGELLLGAVGDTLAALVGQDRYGAVLFEGINPNGTEVPEGFRVVVEEEAAQIPGLYIVPGIPDEPDEPDEPDADEIEGVPV